MLRQSSIRGCVAGRSGREELRRQSASGGASALPAMGQPRSRELQVIRWRTQPTRERWWMLRRCSSACETLRRCAGTPKIVQGVRGSRHHSAARYGLATSILRWMGLRSVAVRLRTPRQQGHVALLLRRKPASGTTLGANRRNSPSRIPRPTRESPQQTNAVIPRGQRYPDAISGCAAALGVYGEQIAHRRKAFGVAQVLLSSPQSSQLLESFLQWIWFAGLVISRFVDA